MTTFTDLISVTNLQTLMESSGARIVDCRFNLMDTGQGHREYREGHIPGAVYAHLDDDLANPVTADSGRHPLPDVDKFARILGTWGIANDTQVVVYDQANGSVAARLWWLRRWVGHEKVAVLDGGFAAWTGAAAALESDVPDYPQTTFVARPDSRMIATTGEIAMALAAGEQLNLVDARDEKRFDGAVEPIDVIAGHIPGAVNLPFQTGVRTDGTWLDADHHRRSWDDLLAGRPDHPLIVMCGSGVTACHLQISARRAGRPEPRLYVGSWSEWIRDPERPVATAK